MELNDYLKLDYPRIVTRIYNEWDGWLWKIEFPDLPGAVHADSDLVTAMFEAEDAKSTWIESSFKDGDKIPLPSKNFIPKSESVIA